MKSEFVSERDLIKSMNNFDDDEFLESICLSAKILHLKNKELQIIIVCFNHILQLEYKLDSFLKKYKAYDDKYMYPKKSKEVKRILMKELPTESREDINKLMKNYNKIIDFRNDISHGRWKQAKYKKYGIFDEKLLSILMKDTKQIQSCIRNIKKKL